MYSTPMHTVYILGCESRAFVLLNQLEFTWPYTKSIGQDTKINRSTNTISQLLKTFEQWHNEYEDLQRHWKIIDWHLQNL